MKTLISTLITLTLLSACSMPGELPVNDPSAAAMTIVSLGSTSAATLPDTHIPSTVTSLPDTPIPATGTPLPDTPIPATEIPPSPTPTPLLLEASTVNSISVFKTFGGGESPRSLAFSPDGTVLASAGGNTEDFIIRMWDVASGNALGTLEGHTGIVWAVAFSPDSQMLASVSNDSTCMVWDWRSGSIIKTLNLPNAISSVTFSPDGQTLAVGGVEEWPDAAIWTFAVPSWQPELKLQEYWNIPAIVYTPDGEYIVGGGISRNARIWRTGDSEHLFTLYHASQVSSLAMSPDGATVASGLAQGALWLWDVETGKLIYKLNNLSEWVENVAYSIDGSLLIAGSRNGMLQFYTSSDYRHIFTTHTPDGNGIFALSPDGRIIAAAGRDGLIHLWRYQP